MRVSRWAIVWPKSSNEWQPRGAIPGPSPTTSQPNRYSTTTPSSATATASQPGHAISRGSSRGSTDVGARGGCTSGRRVQQREQRVLAAGPHPDPSTVGALAVAGARPRAGDARVLPKRAVAGGSCRRRRPTWGRCGADLVGEPARVTREPAAAGAAVARRPDAVRSARLLERLRKPHRSQCSHCPRPEP
jgi:hypothetical protein